MGVVRFEDHLYNAATHIIELVNIISNPGRQENRALAAEHSQLVFQYLQQLKLAVEQVMKEVATHCSSLVRNQHKVSVNIKEAEANIRALEPQVQLFGNEQQRVEKIYHTAVDTHSRKERDLQKWQREHSMRWIKVVQSSLLGGVVLGLGTMGIGLVPGLVIGAVGGIGTGIVAGGVIRPDKAKKEISDCKETLKYCDQMSSKTVSQLSDLQLRKQEIICLLRGHRKEMDNLHYEIDAQQKKLKELTELDRAIKEYLQYVTKAEASARVVERHSRDLYSEEILLQNLQSLITRLQAEPGNRSGIDWNIGAYQPLDGERGEVKPSVAKR